MDAEKDTLTDDELLAEVKAKLAKAAKCEDIFLKNGVDATLHWRDAGGYLWVLQNRRKASKDWTDWVEAQGLNHSTVLNAIEFYVRSKGRWDEIKILPITEARRALGLVRSQEDARRAADKAAKKAAAQAAKVAAGSDAPGDQTDADLTPSPTPRDRRATPTAAMRRRPVAELRRLCVTMKAFTAMFEDADFLPTSDMTPGGADRAIATLQEQFKQLEAAVSAAIKSATKREEERRQEFDDALAAATQEQSAESMA